MLREQVPRGLVRDGASEIDRRVELRTEWIVWNRAMHLLDAVPQERGVLWQPLDTNGENPSSNEAVIPVRYDVAGVRWIEYEYRLIGRASTQSHLKAVPRDP